MDKRVREQLRGIEKEGLPVLRVEATGGTHMRVIVQTPIGERFLIIATSPSSGGATGAAKRVRNDCRRLKKDIERRLQGVSH
jgi:hypothetical protein